MTIGETLKRARKKMGLELDDVVRATKIAKMFLIALENDDISSLPKGVYTRNFLRTYARFLKLDEDIITTEYHEQYAIKPHFVAQQEQTKRDNSLFVQQRNQAILILTVVVILPLSAAGIYYYTNGDFDGIIARWTGAPQTTPEPAPTPQQPPSTVEPTRTEFQPPDQATGNEVSDPDPLPPPEESSDDSNAEVEPPADTVASEVDTATPSTVDEQGGQPGEQPEGEGTTEPEPVVIEKPSVLPVSSLQNVTWIDGRRPAERMEDMFAVEALAEVWVMVTIDDQVVTERLLQPGQVRYYRYGAENSMVLGDTWRVAVQAGGAFRARSHAIKTKISFEFGPGELFAAMDEKVKNQPALEPREE
ncbi:MAG: helix-turn-helix domain-containing protein [Acidobacteriota bacterium]|nr:helix-turn-helix domain-containing protein [Acidobacteriota bacterium]